MANRIRILITAGFVAVAMLFTASPASAGGLIVTSRPPDNFPEICRYDISNRCTNAKNSYLVMLWQTILVFDNGLSCSFVDGQFGPNTANATWNWQNNRRNEGWTIGRDGRVGPQTWGVAKTWFEQDGADIIYRDAWGQEVVRLVAQQPVGGGFVWVFWSACRGWLPLAN